jgi:polysaccharide export outer membrane protein
MLSCWQIGLVSATESQETPTYLIGPGDVLQITVWANPDLSTSTTVRPDGRISVPLVEDLPAAGKTPADLAAAIKDRLSQYLKDPLVTVMVVSGLGDTRQQIRIIGAAAAPTAVGAAAAPMTVGPAAAPTTAGAAAAPKAVAYRSGMTLLDAIIAAGGLSREADGNGAVIVRQEGGTTREIPVRLSDLVQKGDSTANVAMQPGDVIVIPEGFFQGDWYVSYRTTASETFSDNNDLNPDGQRDAGFVTRAGPGISINGSSARVVGAFSGDLIGVYQAGGNDAGFSVDPELTGTSTTELSPDQVFLDLSTSVHRALLDTRKATSASQASTSNTNTVATFSASPYLVHRLGDFADAEWRYRVTPVYVDGGGYSNSLIQQASMNLTSGEDFSLFGWTFSNIARLENRSSQGDIKSANTDLGLSYPLGGGFALLAGVGYEYRSGDQQKQDNFQGVTWRGGFQYDPSPDLNLQATYGFRNNSNNLDASLNYQVGPNTALTASYVDTLETGQGRAASNVQGIVIDPTTGQPVVQQGGPFTFQNQTTHTRTLQVGATHVAGNDSFGLFALKGNSTGGNQGDEDFYEAHVTWSRALTENLNLNALASYQHSKFNDENRTDDTYLVSTSLGYTLSSQTRAFLSYAFQLRDSTNHDDSFTENAVTVGLTVTY